MNHIERILNWNDIAKVDVSPESSELYLELIREELEEFNSARQENNDVETLDGGIDLIWVIVGYLRARGFDVVGAMNEVDRSNYSKFTMNENGQLTCIKRADGKILKPETFSKPNLRAFV